MKVLAFEDSVDIEALLISGGVNLSDIEFKQYWNSEDFLEKIRDYAPDILLLDHYMPPSKGLSVLKMLLDSDVKRPEEIVAMSSASTANNAMLAYGADYGIVKFKLADLEIWNQS